MRPGAVLRLRGLGCGSVRLPPVTARPAVEGARRERGSERRPKWPPGQPRVVHSRPSSHRCISSMSSTHWTMALPALGGTSSSRAPRRVLMSMHRLMAFSMVCGSICSVVASVGSGGGASLPGRHPPPRFRPASSSLRRGTHARRSSRSVCVTEAGRRRPRSPPRRCHWHEGRAELVRRHRGHASHLGGLGAGGDVVVPAAGDFVSVDPDEPAAHGRIVAVRCGRTVPRAANPGRPDMEVTRADETMIRAVAVFVGRAG